MPGYSDTRQLIIDTLMGRPAGTEIQPEDHQRFALQITDYVRSVELVAGNATPIGFANADTVPVQPDNGQAVYLSSVSGAQTVTFSNFIGKNGSPISVTSTENVIKFVTLLWNGQYWSSQVTSVNAVIDTTDGYLFVGVATIETDPDTPDQKVFYIANGKGTYTNFGGLQVTEDEVVILYYDTAWHKASTGIASHEKLSELENEIDTKQDIIPDIDSIRAGAALGATSEEALQSHVNDNIRHITAAERTAWNAKQDTISDLATIRSGAAKGATALQSYTETDPVYTADKPSLALKSEIPDISGKVDKVAGKGLSTNDYTNEDKAKLDSLQNYDDSGIVALINNKSDKGHTHTVSQITDFPSIPSKVSQLTNDSGFISSIPSEYVTDAELNAKGYLTEHQDISGKADVSYVDNKISTLTNVVNGKQDNISDLTAIRNGAALGSTAIQEETDPTVPAWAKSEKKPSYTPSEIGAASQEALQSHVNDNIRHITAAERTKWNAKQDALTAGFGISISGGEISSTLDTNPFIIVSSLPSSGVKDKIYIAPSKNPETGNLTDEWIWNGSAWELLGASKVDLSEYVTDAELNAKGYLTEHQDISGKANVSDLTAHTGNTSIHVTASDKSTWNSKQNAISDLDDIREGAALGKTALQEHQDISGLATKEEVATKQDAISDLATIRSGASKGATALQSYTETDPVYTADKPNLALKSEIPDISGKANVSDLTAHTGNKDIHVTASDKSKWNAKQDAISDLATIRSGASKGATALQSYTETDPVYTADKPNLALKSEIPDISGKANVSDLTAHTGNTGIHVTTSDKSKWNGKQDAISDLDTIRAGAAKGATALQSYTEQYKGTVTSVKINGTNKNPSNGVVDLGTVITSHQDISGKQDKLVSGTNIKTINGKSILGSGDITITSSGGSGGAYPEVNHGTSDTTFTLTPNTFHVWDEVTSLTLTFGSETSGVANEYLFQFTSGSTATSLTLPDDIKWANDNAPTIGANMIYQVSILKGLASVLEFKNAMVFPTIGDGGSNEEYAKVYEYFVTTYNLTSTSASPSNGVAITETLLCNDARYGGPVLKVSLSGTKLLLWTQNAINTYYVPTINSSGVYEIYFWD